MTVTTTSRLRQTTRASTRAGLPFPWRVGLILFFTMLFVPTRYQSVKFVLLAVVLGSIVAARGSVRFVPRHVVVVSVVVIVGALELFTSALRGNPGAVPSWTVWVLWPIVYLLMASAVSTIRHLEAICRTMIVAGVAIPAFGLTFLFGGFGVIPADWIALLDQGQSSYVTQGQFAVSLVSLSSLLFLVPFLITVVFAWPKDRLGETNRGWAIVGLVLCVALVVLSGRRALLVTFALSPAVLFVISKVSGVRRVRLIAPALVLAGVVYAAIRITGINVGATIEYLTSGYKSAGDQARSIQFNYLMAGWREHPVVGNGIGAVADGPIRSIETPWAYELTYIALLFQLGILGMLFYCGTLIAMVWSCLRAAKADPELRIYVQGALVGFSSFLIGTATNPYLLKYDSMWVLFLPLALLHVFAMRQRTQSEDILR